MFSPVNISIKPSKIRRWLSLFIHGLAVVSLCYVALPFYLLVLLAIVITLSAWQDFITNSVVYSLFWDLSQGSIRVAAGDEAFESGEVQKLHLLFGLLFMRIKFDNNTSLKLYIFSDSVDKQSYRKLRVAARWAKLHNSSQDV